MARGKKKETLTPEERLQAALVPESEQPYKVPENWCWTRLGNITEIVGGGTPSSNVTEYYCDGSIPWISPADLSGYTDIYISQGAKNITALGLEKSSAKMLPTNTVCLSSRAPIGYVVIAENPLCTNQGFKSFLPASCYLPRYLYWYLKANKKLLESYASGTTFLELSASKARLVEFPLASLAEQQRIVDRIESLFAKLDEAKQKAQDALDSFETRKAAILHKAFTGELTAQWRKEHGVGMDSWENKKISQIAKQIKAGGDKPDDYTEETDETHIVPVVANGIANEGIIGYTTTARFSGETVTVAGRGTIGFSVYRTYPFFPVVRLIVIEPQDTVKAQYVKYSFDAFPESGTGSSIPQLTVPMVKEKIIPLPGLNEQTEIVCILDDLLAKEQQAKEAAETVLEQIDLIKKAILARAFRGELGTNDPSEESAVELLKQILSC